MHGLTVSKRFTLSLATCCLAVLSLTSHLSAHSAMCEAQDFELKVSGLSQCLLMRRYGPAVPKVSSTAASTAEPAPLVVWLHGDVSSGGPADYHFARAKQFSQDNPSVQSVALVRPGYPDGSGESSSVSLLSAGRSDHYSKDNLAEVGAAIERLRKQYNASRVVVVGHSGGAATTAVLLGMQPGLIDAAVLVACPCDLVAWRTGRRPWSGSENPIKWADRIPSTTRVVAITGAQDDNTLPELARNYTDTLRARQLDATFILVPEATHNGVFRAAEVTQTVQRLLMTK